MINSLGRVMTSEYRSSWDTIYSQSGSGGIAEILKLMEDYTHTLALNMHLVFTSPFDTVHQNLG